MFCEIIEMADTHFISGSTDESITYSITVSDILRVPFECRSETDKMQIVMGGKPRPTLILSAVAITENNDINNEGFKTSIYNKISWLTGCERENNLYCWPCLLFGSLSLWNSIGFSDIRFLKDAASEHEKCVTHMEAVEKMRIFIEKERSKSETLEIRPSNSISNENVQKHVKKDNLRLELENKSQLSNEMVHFLLPKNSKLENKNCFIDIHATELDLPQFPQNFPHTTILNKENYKQNAEVIKKLLDACCLAFQLSHSNENISKTFFEIEHYIKIFELFRNCDSYNIPFYNNVINLIKHFPMVIDITFDIIIKYIELSIKQEMQTSKYVAIILNEHGKAKSELKISTVLRYMKNGTLVERFVGFTKIIDRISVEVLYKHLEETLLKYEIEKKICSLSLDGSLLNITDLSKFFDKVRGSHSSCLFLPWYGHSVNYILQQSLSSLPACREFFYIMGTIQVYFQKNSEFLKNLMSKNNSALLYIYSDSDIVSHSFDKGFASSQFIVTVKNFREDFLNIFDFVVKVYQERSDIDIIKVFTFQKYLKNLQTIFLLEVLTRLFKLTYNLNTSLKSNDFEFCNGKEKNIVHEITLQINLIGKFNEIWKCILKEVSIKSSGVSDNQKTKQICLSLFNDIINLTSHEISIRYQPLIKLTFLNMFNFDTNGGLRQFPLWAQSLKETQIEFFEEQMYNELLFFLKQDSYSAKSVIEFYNLLDKHHLHHVFQSLSSLSELILVMLLNPFPHVSNKSILQTIEKWSSIHSSVPCDHLSILHIEYDYFQTLRQLSFYDDIFSIYADKSSDTTVISIVSK